jgi:hypothetical protein
MLHASIRPESKSVPPTRQVAASASVNVSRFTRRTGPNAVSASSSGQSFRSGGCRCAGPRPSTVKVTCRCAAHCGMCARGFDAVGRMSSELHIQDRRQTAEPLRADAERIDALIDLYAHLLCRPSAAHARASRPCRAARTVRPLLAALLSRHCFRLRSRGDPVDTNHGQARHGISMERTGPTGRKSPRAS